MVFIVVPPKRQSLTLSISVGLFLFIDKLHDFIGVYALSTNIYHSHAISIKRALNQVMGVDVGENHATQKVRAHLHRWPLY